MTENDFQGLVTRCQELDSEKKAQLIRSLLGSDRMVKVSLVNESIVSTNSIPRILNTIADVLTSERGGGHLKFELYREA